jgi:hypothetical protein
MYPKGPVVLIIDAGIVIGAAQTRGCQRGGLPCSIS